MSSIVFRIVTLAVMLLLGSSCWIDKDSRPQQEDTMKYKLKYVRLRPIHEEERLRVQSQMTRQEYEAMKIAVRRELGVDVD